MNNCTLKMICISIFIFMLAIPSWSQNTKGDKPGSNRESRFKKASKKEKPARRIRTKRTTPSLRAYRPRKKSKGGERAGRAVSPVFNSSPSEKPKNVFSQKGPFVHNPSKGPGKGDRAATSPGRKRISTRPSSGSSRNVYPQSGRYVNYSSAPDRGKPGKKGKVVPRSSSRSFTARRSINAWANFPRPKHKREKAYTKDISGRKLRTKNFETKRPRIISVPGGNARSVSGTNRNVFSRSGKFVNKPSAKAGTQPVVSNKATLARLKRLQSGPDKRPRKQQRVIPRSASGAFIARKSTNTWAHFPRPKHKGERAITKDLAGKPLRTKNYETKRPRVLINPTSRPFKIGKQKGDRPYKGPAFGRYESATRPAKPWRGDITKRRIRGRNFTSKTSIEGKPVPARQQPSPPGERTPGQILKGGGFRSASRAAEKRTGKSPLPVRTPKVQGPGSYRGNLKVKERRGMNDQGEEFSGNIKGKNRRGFGDQGEEYTGNLKSRRPLKGGGSVSGRLWNNQGRAVPTRTPGIGSTGIGKYQGNIRARRGMNDQGEEFSGNIKVKDRRGFGDQGEEYTGNLKSRRPLKGGGSVSGRLWNNQGRAVPTRTPGIGSAGIGKYQGNIRMRRGMNDQGEEYSGNIKVRNRLAPSDQGEEFSGNLKARKPLKGGGSVSGRLWNNQQRAIPTRTPGIGSTGIGKYQGNIRLRDRGGLTDQGEEYSGNIKARRPLKGGGSVSGKFWNNRQTPIPSKAPSNETMRAAGYSGNIRAERSKPAFNDQGEEYSGSLKAKRPDKGGGSVSGKLWNNKQTPIPSKAPSNETMRAAGYSGNIRAERSKPAFNDQGEEFAGAIKRKRGSYIRNPNAADEALKVREPGKAFGRAGDYQGNIKMHKYELFSKRGLHPDAKFVKINKNNVAEEKDVLTNFKLWWSRLFKKNETQPEHLKDKRGKPRYDKGESGLWYD